MILHCWRCSLIQDKIRIDTSELSWTAVAKIHTDKLKLPLTADMFEMFNSRLGELNWPDDWRHMLHRGHVPWHNTFDEDVIKQRIEEGGPRKLLTDEGWIEICESGILKPEQFATAIKASGNTVSEALTNLADYSTHTGYECPYCPETFETKRQRQGHIMGKHKNVKSDDR